MKTNVCYHGNCLDVLKILPENSVDSIVTDPPYELGFMGKSWDNSGIAYNVDMWKECLRVLKPGGHLLSFSGTRTYHRMAVAIEDAWFEVRDMIEWVYGSGFPKSLNIGKAVSKIMGEEVKQGVAFKTAGEYGGRNLRDPTPIKDREQFRHKPTTDEGKQWEGWGTALKPAHEPICLARKPLAEKTVAENVLKYGTGGINIDESRVKFEKGDEPSAGNRTATFGTQETISGGDGSGGFESNNLGRFPANLLHDNSEEVRECFPESGGGKAKHNSEITRKGIAQDGSSFNAETCGFDVNKCQGMANFGDSGNASRFFKSILYYPKASKSERNKGCEGLEEKVSGHRSNFRCQLCGYQKASGTPCKCENPVWDEIPLKPQFNNHPTVKPVALMSYLIKMITPKGGIVLDPFTGSGSTLVAAKENGFQYIGIELTEEYLPIIEARTGCEIIKPEIINEENIVSDLIEKDLPYTPVVNSGICECGGKIKKTASGKCCEWCMKDY